MKSSCIHRLGLAPIVAAGLLISQAAWAQQPTDGSAGVTEAGGSASEVPVQPKATPDPVIGEPVDKRILGVLPNYRTADGTVPFQPISWQHKILIASKDSFDWPSYLTGAVFAGIYMMDKDHPDFGQGVGGFARYYGTSTADQVIGNMLTEGFMAAAFREDPRYFRKSHGSVWGRLGYAATRVLVCKNDHGNPTFNFAEVVGNSTGASIANLYYSDQRGVHETAVRAGTQIATDALSNVAKEFWPDIKRRLHRQQAGSQSFAQGTDEKPRLQMRFEFFPLRFELVTRDPLYFPPGKAGNTLRGALGSVFQRLVFEPASSAAPTVPSGLSDPPAPFVLRARHLDGRSYRPEELFHVDLNLFSVKPDVLAGFVRSFQELAHDGLGSRRTKVDLQCVRRLAFNRLPEQILTGDPAQQCFEPVALDLDPQQCARNIRVDFLSPTELKHKAGLVSQPEFPILLARVRDRISTLRALYGGGPLDVDFQGMNDRAASVQMVRCEVRREEVERRSTRTGQSHSIGGFVGFAEYEGEMAEFLPYLEVAHWVGVGRQTVWGKGEIAVSQGGSAFPGEHGDEVALS